jgi:cytochrome P450
MQLGPVTVPKGMGVAASITLVHYNPELYPDPTRFDIDRFARRRYGAHEYLPFGGGHRRCLGAAFAGYQLQIVLGILLRGFHVRLLDSQPPQPVRRSLTLAPDTGVPAIIERRRAGYLPS